jgi:leucyl-tRNA synthetase
LVRKVGDDLSAAKFNTAISAMMEFVNQAAIDSREGVIEPDEWQAAALTFARVFAPFAPHAAEEIWQALGQTESVHLERWPTYQEKLAAESVVTIAVQVNGKLRGEFVYEVGKLPGAFEEEARRQDDQHGWTQGLRIIKVITVPDRLVNFVVTD